MSALDGPVFTKRPGTDHRYQVRFWSTQQDYSAFTEAVQSEGLVIQDVFNELMIWFTQAHHEKRLRISGVAAPVSEEPPYADRPEPGN